MEELLSNPGDAGIATRSSLALMAEFSGSKDHLYERAMPYNIKVLSKFGL